MDDNKKNNKIKRTRTQTSEFGASGRYGHDSSKFYSGKLYSDISKIKSEDYFESPLKNNIKNRIFCKSAEQMDDIQDSSVHLMVTSPPYYNAREYSQWKDINDYLINVSYMTMFFLKCQIVYINFLSLIFLIAQNYCLTM